VKKAIVRSESKDSNKKEKKERAKVIGRAIRGVRIRTPTSAFKTLSKPTIVRPTHNRIPKRWINPY
jgi:hypothetical protein